MGNVYDLQRPRLAGLRQREQLLRDAEQARARAQVAVGPKADDYLWALRVALELSTDGHSVGDRDPALEREGAAAVDELALTFQAVIGATQAVHAEIAYLVQSGQFQVGDEITTGSRTLRCESIFTPPHEPTLAEATFTGDGKPIDKSWHSWPLDGDGHPITEDVEPVRYERWWGGGLRTGGFVHPQTRKIVETD